MSIRQAILAAAAHIEANPQWFNFNSWGIPSAHKCKSPGCALGWIGAFHGMDAADHGFSKVASNILRLEKTNLSGAPDEHGFSEFNFYHRMDNLHGDTGWRHTSDACASAMRLYADAHHPAAPVIFPNWSAMAAVRTIGDDVADTVRA